MRVRSMQEKMRRCEMYRLKMLRSVNYKHIVRHDSITDLRSCRKNKLLTAVVELSLARIYYKRRKCSKWASRHRINSCFFVFGVWRLLLLEDGLMIDYDAHCSLHDKVQEVHIGQRPVHRVRQFQLN